MQPKFPNGFINVTYFMPPNKNKQNKLRGFGPLANYADRATAACW
jgi:hypothetical protein